MKNILLVLLLLVAIFMMLLGVSKGILPPIFTGIGFVIIALLLKK